MKLHSISLTNFLCYNGENNKIIFDEGLNLILGANGYGKTKLYDAFQWVFKDGITDDLEPGRIKKTTNLKRALISEKALIDCEIGSKVSCKVVIEVSDSKDKYQLRREYFVTKVDEENWLEEKESSFEVYWKHVIDFKPLTEKKAMSIPKRLIRDEIMPYVWFQGEKGVNSIIDTKSKGALRRVINNLSDVEKWDEFLEIIQKVAKTANNSFDKQLKIKNRNQDEYSRLDIKKNQLRDLLDRKKEELYNVINNLEVANNSQDSVIGKLASAGKINNLRKTLEKKINDLREVNSRIESFQLGFTKRLFSDLWLLMDTEKLFDLFEGKCKSYNEFINQRKVAESLKSQTRLPRGIPERMHLKRMLEEQTCLVCNRPAPKGTQEYEAIRELLPERANAVKTKPDIEADLSLLNKSCFLMMDKFTNSEAQIKQAIHDREEFIRKQVELEEEIKSLEAEINNEILNSGIEEASDIVATAEVTKRDIQIYSSKKGRLEAELENLSKEWRTVEEKLKKLSIGNVDSSFLKKKEVLEDLVDLTERVKNKQYKSLVKQLEEAANFHYENINKPTGAFYGKIEFVETSNGGCLPVNIDDHGKRISNPNTSQTSSLKLSIILAIMSANKKRGYNNRYPLIADAPISDFDPSKKASFLIETAKTFNQSLVFIYDFLNSDNERKNRFKPNIDKLQELQEAIEKNGKKLTVHHLDIPDGISMKNRSELSINIKPIKLK